jgi:hypothetical protein
VGRGEGGEGGRGGGGGGGEGGGGGGGRGEERWGRGNGKGGGGYLCFCRQSECRVGHLTNKALAYVGEQQPCSCRRRGCAVVLAFAAPERRWDGRR